MIHVSCSVSCVVSCVPHPSQHVSSSFTMYHVCIMYVGYMIHVSCSVLCMYQVLYHVCVDDTCIMSVSQIVPSVDTFFSVRNTLIQVYHVYYVCITTGTWWYIHDTDMILYHPNEMIHVSTDDTMIHDDTRWYCIIFSGFRFSGLDTLLDTLHDTRWYTHKRWYTMIHAWYRDDTVSNRKVSQIG